jgi:tetratricopeptide (TPR) repeat protein
MSFLKKMFGKRDPVEEIRALHTQKDWAGLLAVAKRVDREDLDETTRAELAALEVEAGDALAELNLSEGAWAQKSGNLLRAREDFQLAIVQAKSATLRERAELALTALEQGEPVPESSSNDDGPAMHAGCGSGCGTAGSAAAEMVSADDADLDDEGRLELLLATLPPELAERYAQAGPAMQQAWLAAQDDDPSRAMDLLGQVPEVERNALFLLERGALQVRSGDHDKGRQDLQAALTVEPDLFPAFDALVASLASSGAHDKLGQLLKKSLAEKRFSGFCWARLAEQHAGRGELEPALAAGLKALEEGEADPNVLVLCAQVLERDERFDEAEGLLSRISVGGGCSGGGAHPLLAEFWLRREKNPEKALEVFKGVLRQEPDNPRWVLRIAQSYLLKGWTKQAAEQVEQLMARGGLPDGLAAEVRATADRLEAR